jgi:phosphatidylinositol 4-kinase
MGPGGVNSDMFHYFENLFLRGFLELRAHYPEFVSLVSACAQSSFMPCFLEVADGSPIVAALEERFLIHCGEDECISHLRTMIANSVNNWKSVQYDVFQKYSNNIL